MLAPTLSPGDVVVAGNLACHKHPQVRRILRAQEARLILLPRYSPDLNPIEQVFAKPRTLLRKLDAGSLEDTWRGIGRLLAAFAPAECSNYLVNAGYAPG